MKSLIGSEAIPKVDKPCFGRVVYRIGRDDCTGDIYKSSSLYSRKIAKVRKWQLESDEIEVITEFLRDKKLMGISAKQLMRYMDSLKKFIEINGTLKSPTEEHLKRFLVETEKYKPSTRQKMWYCVKKFLEARGYGVLYENFTVNFHAEKLRPQEEIWTPKEMEALINSARNSRDRAFLALMCEGGYRIGEILSAKIRNVQFFDGYCKIMVEGKTGWRNPPIVNAANDLKIHIREKNKDSLIFNFCYATSRDIMKEARDRSGVNKEVSQQILRASAATRDANYLTEPQLCLKYGWRFGSRTPSRYVRMSGRDLDEAVLKHHGIIRESL